MAMEKHPYICPAEFSGSLDNRLRRLFHNPLKIMGSYIASGMTVIDLGCGPGYFTKALATLVGEGGRVIAADLQQKMLDKVDEKIRGTNLEGRVEKHLCQQDRTGISQKADFILAFWMVHEVPDQRRMFGELKLLLSPGGRIMVIEPKIHVTAREFKNMILHIDSSGLKIIERPKVTLSRSLLLGV
ncbi:MAG: class I SAM-dependent methyltransferase [Bacteroidales bacterium]|jgi:ubiquinone/menaquinone biosynthesis C-methylase UbiE|nr:class I SAM-dependent methyltransferase [Bacteroidales bacterium]